MRTENKILIDNITKYFKEQMDLCVDNFDKQSVLIQFYNRMVSLIMDAEIYAEMNKAEKLPKDSRKSLDDLIKKVESLVVDF